MLTGPPLGAALLQAIRKKGVSKTQLARDFGIKPPSVYDWIEHGRIGKQHIDKLIHYFRDVCPPEHWGVTGTYAVAAGVLAKRGREWQASSSTTAILIENVRRKVKSTPPAALQALAGEYSVDLEVLHHPARHLTNPTMADIDALGLVLSTPGWMLLHPHAKSLDDKLDFIEELLKAVAETTDLGRGQIVNAMRLAQQLAPPSAEGASSLTVIAGGGGHRKQTKPIKVPAQRKPREKGSTRNS